ncbi:hypothetical protein JW949_02180 [Candidatus Woesearchaeota archaeon]|nr:hypothetical protein [Candidatus Woesearchaeota archaeon]
MITGIKNKIYEGMASTLAALTFGMLKSNPNCTGEFVGYNLFPETYDVEKEKNVYCIAIHRYGAGGFNICNENPITTVSKAWEIYKKEERENKRRSETI